MPTTLTRINSKTWISSKNPEKLNDYQRKLNTYSLIGATKKANDKLPRAIVNSREKDYINFLKEVFNDHSYMSEKAFNKLLKLEFKNSTWYRNRLIALGFVSSKNKVIKLNINLQTLEKLDTNE